METATQERTSRAFEQAADQEDTVEGVQIVLRGRAAAASDERAQLTKIRIFGGKRQGARLAAELQIVALEGLTDPLHLHYRGCLETLESTRRALTLIGTSARLVTQASDRLQTAAMDTGRRIRETLESGSGTRDTTRR